MSEILRNINLFYLFSKLTKWAKKNRKFNVTEAEAEGERDGQIGIHAIYKDDPNFKTPYEQKIINFYEGIRSQINQNWIKADNLYLPRLNKYLAEISASTLSRNELQKKLNEKERKLEDEKENCRLRTHYHPSPISLILLAGFQLGIDFAFIASAAEGIASTFAGAGILALGIAGIFILLTELTGKFFAETFFPDTEHAASGEPVPRNRFYLSMLIGSVFSSLLFIYIVAALRSTSFENAADLNQIQFELNGLGVIFLVIQLVLYIVGVNFAYSRYSPAIVACTTRQKPLLREVGELEKTIKGLNAKIREAEDDSEPIKAERRKTYDLSKESADESKVTALKIIATYRNSYLQTNSSIPKSFLIEPKLTSFVDKADWTAPQGQKSSDNSAPSPPDKEVM